MPRSLAACYENLTRNLDQTDVPMAGRGPGLCPVTQSRLQNMRIDEVFQSGLHDFITDFIAENNRLGSAIAGTPQEYLV